MSTESHRRVALQPSFLLRDQVSGLVTGPTSAAFRPKRGEDGLSVYRDEVLSRDSVPVERVARSASTPSVVAGIDDVIVTNLGLSVTPDPQNDPSDIGPAHALIVGWEAMTSGAVHNAARAMSRTAACTYPGGGWGGVALP